MCTLQTSLTVCRVGVWDVGPHKAVCNLWRQVGPAGSDCSSILYPYACAPKSIKTNSAPHLWNTLIMQTSRQFLLQYPPVILILGQTILLSREGTKEECIAWTHIWRLNYLFSLSQNEKIYRVQPLTSWNVHFFHLLKLQQIKSCCHFFLLHVIPSKFSSVSVSFCSYFSLSYKVHFYAMSNEIKLLYTTYYSLEISHRIIPLIFFIFFSVMSEILIFFPLFLTHTHTKPFHPALRGTTKTYATHLLIKFLAVLCCSQFFGF